MKNYDCVVFDFNGTIIDDVELCYTILNLLLKERGYSEVNLEKYKHIFTFPIINYYKAAGFDLKKHAFEDISKEFIALYQPLSYQCNLFDDVKETIQKIKEKGSKVILLSASQIDNLLNQTDHFGITNLFDTVLGLDNIHASSKIAIAQEYFKKNNCNSILFVGDTLHDFEVSKALGGDCILMSYGHQSKDVIQKANTTIADSMKQLLSILENEHD